MNINPFLLRYTLCSNEYFYLYPETINVLLKTILYDLAELQGKYSNINSHVISTRQEKVQESVDHCIWRVNMLLCSFSSAMLKYRTRNKQKYIYTDFNKWAFIHVTLKRTCKTSRFALITHLPSFIHTSVQFNMYSVYLVSGSDSKVWDTMISFTPSLDPEIDIYTQSILMIIYRPQLPSNITWN